MMSYVDWRGFGLDGCIDHKPADGECEVEDTSLLDDGNYQVDVGLVCQRSGGVSRWVDGTIANNGNKNQRKQSLHVVDHRRWFEDNWIDQHQCCLCPRETPSRPLDDTLMVTCCLNCEL